VGTGLGRDPHPRAFAWRIASTPWRVETCCRWMCPPVSSARRRSRTMWTSSEAFGFPRIPSRAETSPSFMAPPRESPRSSGWSATGMSKAWRTRAPPHEPRVHDGVPVVGDRHRPASTSSPISVSRSPFWPIERGPPGRPGPPRRPTRRGHEPHRWPGESMTGSVFGMAQTEVKPRPPPPPGPRRDRLLVLAAGLPQVHVHVDEPGHDQSPSHSDLRALGRLDPFSHPGHPCPPRGGGPGPSSFCSGSTTRPPFRRIGLGAHAIPPCFAASARSGAPPARR
jgi:hypothetical protein